MKTIMTTAAAVLLALATPALSASKQEKACDAYLACAVGNAAVSISHRSIYGEAVDSIDAVIDKAMTFADKRCKKDPIIQKDEGAPDFLDIFVRAIAIEWCTPLENRKSDKQ